MPSLILFSGLVAGAVARSNSKGYQLALEYEGPHQLAIEYDGEPCPHGFHYPASRPSNKNGGSPISSGSPLSSIKVEEYQHCADSCRLAPICRSFEFKHSAPDLNCTFFASKQPGREGDKSIMLCNKSNPSCETHHDNEKKCKALSPRCEYKYDKCLVPIPNCEDVFYFGAQVEFEECEDNYTQRCRTTKYMPQSKTPGYVTSRQGICTPKACSAKYPKSGNPDESTNPDIVYFEIRQVDLEGECLCDKLSGDMTEICDSSHEGCDRKEGKCLARGYAQVRGMKRNDISDSDNANAETEVFRSDSVATPVGEPSSKGEVGSPAPSEKEACPDDFQYPASGPSKMNGGSPLRSIKVEKPQKCADSCRLEPMCQSFEFKYSTPDLNCTFFPSMQPGRAGDKSIMLCNISNPPIPNCAAVFYYAIQLHFYKCADNRKQLCRTTEYMPATRFTLGYAWSRNGICTPKACSAKYPNSGNPRESTNLDIVYFDITEEEGICLCDKLGSGREESVICGTTRYEGCDRKEGKCLARTGTKHTEDARPAQMDQVKETEQKGKLRMIGSQLAAFYNEMKGKAKKHGKKLAKNARKQWQKAKKSFLASRIARNQDDEEGEEQ